MKTSPTITDHLIFILEQNPNQFDEISFGKIEILIKDGRVAKIDATQTFLPSGENGELK